MNRIIRWTATALASLATVVVALGLGACFTDGPVAIFPGGTLRSGAWADGADVDWSAWSDLEQIELESDGRSRTTWFLVVDGEPYVPCNLGFPPFKRWHERALEEPAAVVRIDGKRYRRELRKVDDPALHARLYALGAEKYSGGSPGASPEGMWFFHLAPPAAEGPPSSS